MSTNSRPVAVSLFDMTGNMVRPLAEAGWDCYCLDIQNDNRSESFHSGGTIWYLQADLLSEFWEDAIVAQKPDFIFSFTPCTDLAVSGAKHFAKKLQADPQVWDKAMTMFRLAQKIADRVGCPYMIENPVSKAATLWRRPDYTFQPFEYGGYLPEDDVHPQYPEYIMPRDAYPKKTCLWTGNGFVMPEKRPVPVNAGYSVQFKKLGGKSLKTKNIRSATPRGFAIAVCEEILAQHALKEAA